MSPEKRARAEAFLSEEFGQLLVDALNEGVLRNCERREREEQKRREEMMASSQDQTSGGKASD